jgi:hypothetical protein
MDRRVILLDVALGDRLAGGDAFSRDGLDWPSPIFAGVTKRIEPEGSSYEEHGTGRGLRSPVPRCRFVVGSGFSRDVLA